VRHLTDERIDEIAQSMPGGLDGFIRGWGWRQFAYAVLEEAEKEPEQPPKYSDAVEEAGRSMGFAPFAYEERN